MFYFLDSRFWVALELPFEEAGPCRDRILNGLIPIIEVLMLRHIYRVKLNGFFLQSLSNQASWPL